MKVLDGDLRTVLQEFMCANPEEGFKSLQQKASERFGGDVNFCRVQRLVRAMRKEGVEREAAPPAKSSVLQSVPGWGLLNKMLTAAPEAADAASRAEKDSEGNTARDLCADVLGEDEDSRAEKDGDGIVARDLCADMLGEGNAEEPHSVVQNDLATRFPVARELFGDEQEQLAKTTEGVEVVPKIATTQDIEVAAKIATAQDAALERCRQATRASKEPQPRTPAGDVRDLMDLVDISARAAGALEAARERKAPRTPAKAEPQTPSKAETQKAAAEALEAAKSRSASKMTTSQPCTPAKGMNAEGIEPFDEVAWERKEPRTPAKDEIAAQAAEAIEAAKTRSASNKILEAHAANALEAARMRKGSTPVRLELGVDACATPRAPDQSEVAAMAAAALQAARLRTASSSAVQAAQPFEDEFWAASSLAGAGVQLAKAPSEAALPAPPPAPPALVTAPCAPPAADLPILDVEPEEPEQGVEATTSLDADSHSTSPCPHRLAAALDMCVRNKMVHDEDLTRMLFAESDALAVPLDSKEGGKAQTAPKIGKKDEVLRAASPCRPRRSSEQSADAVTPASEAKGSQQRKAGATPISRLLGMSLTPARDGASNSRRR